ncbi:MAG: hypothetical protein AB7N80_13385 [Bdellovibrionales bacterium]
MRALRILIVILILLVAVPGYAGMSDPNEIVENSQVDPALVNRTKGASSDNILQKATAKVSETVTNTVGTSVNAVKSWWKKGVETLTGQKPTATAKPESKTTPAKNAKGITPAEVERQKQVQALTETFATPGLQQEVRAADMREARRQLKKEGAAVVAKPGRKAQGNLKLSKSGVPLFPMEVKQTVKLPGGKTKIVMSPMKNIPRLDIGEEPILSKSDYIGKNYQPKLVEVQEFKSLPSPELMHATIVQALTGKLIGTVAPAKDLDKGLFGIDKIVTKEAIAKAMPKIAQLAKVSEKIVRELSEPQLKMLTALILYNKGDRCHILLGLFDELSKNEKLANESNFHLGQCAYRMKMTSLGFERLSALIMNEDREFASDAIKTLAKDLPMEYEIAFSKLIRNLKNQKLIPKESTDEVNYLTAKGAVKEGDHQTGRSYAEKVPESSPRYGNSQYLIGVAWFSLGNANKGAGKLESLRNWMATKKINDKNLNSLTAINLARIKFTQGRFKEALPLYMAIDKDHPLWVQGLIEQGWTQLAQDDFSGAIGNMYSLHSPYFRSVYKPESFVVRTIGYLNICQYGDAYRTLSWLEREYRPWVEGVNQYIGKRKLASEYYDTTIRYLKGKSSDDMDGLPYQIIREMARQKEFLNAQTSLNAKAEEVGRYEGIDKLITQEKAALKARENKATARFKDLKTKLAKAEKEKVTVPQMDEWRRQMKLEREVVIGLRYQAEMLENSRKSYLKLQPRIMAKIERERYNLRETAGRDLVETLKRVKIEMGTVLENNEFLRYEVFAGSGENIRYQVAGGKVADANRVPASVKPEKLQNWSFDGEYWEDEIGSYRSSLRNNCPQVGKMEEFFKDKQDDGSRAPASAEDAKGQAAIEKGAGK